MPAVLDHIKSLFNQQTLSDFVLIDDKGKKLYLHKLILYVNPYFKQFFESAVTADKSQMKVNSFEAAERLVWYLYTGEFVMPEHFEPSDFVDLCDLVEMWQLPKSIKESLFQYLESRWQTILNVDLGYGNILLRHFNDQPSIELQKKYSTGGTYKVNWSSRILKDSLIKHMEDKKDSITLEMTDWDLFKLLPSQSQVEVLVRLGAYNKISLESLRGLVGYINKYYDPKTKVFTPKQLSAFKTSKLIGGPKCAGATGKSEDKTLVVKSLVPFSGRMYHYLGEVSGKSKQHSSIFVPLESNFNTQLLQSGSYDKKLCVSGQIYTIKSIYLDTEEITSGECFTGSEYSLALVEAEKVELPNKGNAVFWVEDI